MSTNKTPEQKARDNIDKMLESAGWVIQNKQQTNFSAAKGVAIREYQTEVGPADYVLWVDGIPVGIIEAKRESEGVHLTKYEEQSRRYAESKLKYNNNDHLPFVYESTGTITRFTDYRDPKPRSRPIFHFHKPETLIDWFKQKATLRKRLIDLPELNTEGLRKAQIEAIHNLEQSFKNNKPRAVIQMATGAGKTFTACTFTYRLLKHAKAKRILFLVDTKNLGEQAEQEFSKYQPLDDNRKFTELYSVQRLTSNYIAEDSQVCISTIQRLYSILQGKNFDDAVEKANQNEIIWDQKEPLQVKYSSENPIEQFDFIIIDECHRSIYNLWKQVLDYFDAFLVGLTATPDKRTFGFFDENVVSEYTYDQSVIDGVNVPFNVYLIETERTTKGGKIEAYEYVDKRDKLSRKKRWMQLDEDIEYTSKQLDKDVVNPSQIRVIIKAFKEALPKIFPDRIDEEGNYEVPKTLVFAKTDSHADDIIQVIRAEFNEGNDFCKKLTYKIEEDPKSVLSQFRNSWAPRIAVTVDMIATGTDVKPLEVLLFMRDVKSKNYFVQMKGRGTRSIDFNDLKRVTRTAKHTKTHFIIIDAIGITKHKMTDSRPLERKPTVSLNDLLNAVMYGQRDSDLYHSLANRLIRLEKTFSDEDKELYEKITNGISMAQTAKHLLEAYDPDKIEAEANKLIEEYPKGERTPEIEEECRERVQNDLLDKARSIFSGELVEYVMNAKRKNEQIIDHINQDKLISSKFDAFTKEVAENVIQGFKEYIESHKDEIIALRLFYGQPYQRRNLTYKMISELLKQLKNDKPTLAPHYVWEAYAKLDRVRHDSPKSELVALVSLVRNVTGIDELLTPYDNIVKNRFKEWIFEKHQGAGRKFTEEQLVWLRMIRDHIASSFHISTDDMEYTPFQEVGSIGKMYQLFGDNMNSIIDELNEVLAA